MTERANSDAEKQSEAHGRAEHGYGLLWPDGAPWPDSSDHRHAQLPATRIPRVRPPARPPVRRAVAPESLEQTVRGTVFAAAVIPLAVVFWLFLWRLGWVASGLGFVTAAGAARLYAAGSASGRGGSPNLTRRGAAAAAAAAAATVLLAFLGGLWLDLADSVHASPLGLPFEPGAGRLLGDAVAGQPQLVEGLRTNFLLALLSTALGTWLTVRRARRRRG